VAASSATYDAVMQWVLHGEPEAMAEVEQALQRLGHKTHALAELELGPVVEVGDVLHAAGARQWDVITADAGLAMLRQPFGRCIVYLQQGASGGAVDRLFERYPRLNSGRLYTVTAGRVKIRQLPRK
jgi:hypothetical protein